MPKSIDIRKTKKKVVNLKRPKKLSSSLGTSGSSSPTINRTEFRRVSKKPLLKYFDEGKAGYKKIYRSPKKKKFSFLTFLLVLLLLLITAAVAGFFVFYDKGPMGKSLKLALAAPKEVTAGEDFILGLYYENLDSVALGQIEVVIEYPENFYFVKANIEPINEEKNVWHLVPLPAGQNDQIEVTGYLIGEVDNKEEFRAIFNYQPENFNSNFQEDINKKVTISDTVLKVSLEVPEMIEDGEEIELKVKFKNNFDEALENLVLAFDTGEAFNATEINPATTDMIWLIKKLEPNSEEEIFIKGKIDSTLANPWDWAFNAGIMETALKPVANKEEPVRYLYKTSGQVVIEAPKIVINFALADAEQEVSWGQEINYKIDIENNGEIDVNQAVLKLTFLSDFIEWGNFNNQSKAKLEAETNSLVWLSTNGGWTNELALIEPGDKIELSLSVPLQNEPEDLVDYFPEELIIEAVATLSFKSQEEHKVFSSEHLMKNIASQPSLITEAKYYLDEFTEVGSGPIPPVINEATTYRIYWKLFSGSNGLADVKIKTTLPPYISWVPDSAEVTIGSPVQFDSATKEVIWNINNISPNSQLMANFDVSVVPDESQINQLLILSNPTSLEATEQQTNESVSETSNLLTSDLIGDPVAQGQGRVTVE